jgi:hypothetical protein
MAYAHEIEVRAEHEIRAFDRGDNLFPQLAHLLRCQLARALRGAAVQARPHSLAQLPHRGKSPQPDAAIIIISRSPQASSPERKLVKTSETSTIRRRRRASPL